jgi:CHAT domain-containing protein
MGKGFSKSQEAKLHHKACLAFLDKVLEKILQGKDDAQVMLFLEANLDKLDHNFAKLLRSWGISKRTQGQLRHAEKMAGAINIFSKLIQELRFGSKANNLEIAIRGYKVAAPFLTRNVSPQTWAETQNNMGNAYCNRFYGEQAENLEQALCCYKAALQVYTKEKFPKDWAWTLNLLGTVYHDRLRDNQEKNLEKAICCYKAALQVYTENKFPQGWADTNNNLGNAYCQRIQDNKEDNLELAIVCYKSALATYTQQQDKFTQEWIITQNNLGNAYSNRIRGNSKENIELAIGSYQAALEICLLEVFPEEWATLRNNLGNAYRHCTKNNKIENLEVAIHYYLDALKVRTLSNFPKYHAVTQFNLGITYLDAQQFDKSYSAFVTAIETVESLRSEIFYGSRKEEDRQRLAEQWNKLYQRMVEVCLELGYYDQAIEYAERSKTRNLVEQILTRDLKSIVTQEEDLKKLEKLRYEIASGQYDIQNAKAENPTALAQHLQQLRQQRNELQDRYLPIGYGFKFDQFQATLDDHTAIIQWYITSAGFETFIITRHSTQRLNLPTPADDLNNLIDWANDYLEAFQPNTNRKIKTQWRNRLASRLSCLAEILHLDNPNSKDDILRHVPKKCDRLILIPHRYLHLFPLHAMPLANGDFLCDRFSSGVGYAPSCQLLQLAQKREQHRHEFTRILAIQNPTRKELQDLTGTEIQLEKICQHFDSDHSIVLREKEATEAALITEQVRSPHCLHFCCHGSFDFGSPLKSALHLAESEGKLGADADLTLGKIFEKLNLDQCRLVTFSACETGITDPTSISDEYVGLLSAFLYAGSPSVVSTLWSVEQAATNLFMIEFYKNLKQLLPLKPGSVAIALNQTQKWLRTLTGEELRKIVESSEFKRHLDDNKNKLFKELLETAKLKPYPFEKPYYWAGFVATGL